MTKLFGATAMRAVAKKVAAKALTKTWYYLIVKKIAAMLGQKIVKATFARGLFKAVPIIGGAASVGLTLATFKLMANNEKSAPFPITESQVIKYTNKFINVLEQYGILFMFLHN